MNKKSLDNLETLKQSLLKMKNLRGAHASFIREFNRATSLNYNQSLVASIINGKVTFERSLNLDKALEIAQNTLNSRLKGQIEFKDKVDWIFLSREQLKDFITKEILSYTNGYNSFFSWQEKKYLYELLAKYQLYDANFSIVINQKFKQFLDYSFSDSKAMNGFKAKITPSIIQLLNTLSIAFPAGHTATAAVLFYLKKHYNINWKIDYKTTHSIYLKNSIKKQDISPDILIIADSLAFELFHNTFAFKNFCPFMFLWQNDMVILGKNTSKKITTNNFKGDFFFNQSYLSGAVLLFENLKRSKVLNNTLQGQHNFYEKTLEILLGGDKNDQNFVITNTTQARLYSSIKDIIILPSAYFSCTTDNIVFFNNQSFKHLTTGYKTTIIKAIKYLFFEVIYQLHPMSDFNLNEIVNDMMGDKEFLDNYLESKSIKLIDD